MTNLPTNYILFTNYGQSCLFIRCCFKQDKKIVKIHKQKRKSEFLVRKLFPRPWRHVQELIMQQFLTRILHIGILLQLAAKKMNIWMFFRKNYVKPLSDFEIKTDFKNVFSNKVNPIHIKPTKFDKKDFYFSAFSTNNATNMVIQIHSIKIRQSAI